MESDYPRLPFVPEREALTRAVRGEVDASKGKAAVNWAIPSKTFPIVVALLAVPEYHDAIGEREATTNTVYCSGCLVSSNGVPEVLRRFSDVFLRLLHHFMLCCVLYCFTLFWFKIVVVFVFLWRWGRNGRASSSR